MFKIDVRNILVTIRVSTLSNSYINTTGIIMQSLKSIRQFLHALIPDERTYLKNSFAFKKGREWRGITLPIITTIPDKHKIKNNFKSKCHNVNTAHHHINHVQEEISMVVMAHTVI